MCRGDTPKQHTLKLQSLVRVEGQHLFSCGPSCSADPLGIHKWLENCPFLSFSHSQPTSMRFRLRIPTLHIGLSPPHY
eukprot:1159029-Pelagomonas_calceolata.AAC.6